MKSRGSPSGTRVAGTRSPRHQAWRAVLSIAVLVLACLYAAPNLYPPDNALQIRAESADPIAVGLVDEVSRHLEDHGVDIKRVEVTSEGMVVRLRDEAAQLRAQNIIEDQLNPASEDHQFVVALSFAPNTPKWLQRLGAKPMALGLDLAGGIHFVLEVAVDQAISMHMTDIAERATAVLRGAGIHYLDRPQDMVSGTAVRVPFRTPEDRDEASMLLADSFRLPDIRLDATETEGRPVVEIALQDLGVRKVEDIAIEKNLAGMRNRVDELGVAEPLIQRLGHSRIVIDLPGMQDSSEAKRKLEQFATLDFRLGAFPSDAPSRIEVMDYQGHPQHLQRTSIVTGENVIEATQNHDPETGAPQVSIKLDSSGGAKMHRATAPNIGHPMAIIFVEQKPFDVKKLVDGEVKEVTEIRENRRLISVATIQAGLSHDFRITGLNSAREARDLAFLLRAGALAAPMYIVEERTVGASLGQENVDRGVLSVSLGLAAVLVFMVGHYKVFGLIANLALAMNIILLVAVMSLLGATLTLPGIAGIVLTVGMAVDANVLVFSRIREELKNSAPVAAIRAGYDRAFLTVLDANVTTLFVALILLAIGSGPVAGFAVTLSIGILTSMFTAIFVSRTMVQLIYGRGKPRKLSI